jgi:hypothetical protein
VDLGVQDGRRRATGWGRAVTLGLNMGGCCWFRAYLLGTAKLEPSCSPGKAQHLPRRHPQAAAVPTLYVMVRY